MFNEVIARRRLFTSLVAALVPLVGLAPPSCASPPLRSGGYPLRASAAGYELQVLVDGVPVQSFDHGGESFVMGQLGARYTLRLVNHTGRRIEAVMSVDGRDAIDGKTADFRSKRGYLVPAWGTVDVDGWRLSRAEVAAFRFSTVADSYAARTGNAREVGVIGVAIFPERYLAPRPVYAPPSRDPDWRYRDDGLGYAPPASEGNAAAKKAARAGADFDRVPSQPAPAAATPPSGRAEAAPSSPRSADALAERESRGPAPQRRPGLGTEFGEAVNSPVREVSFVRANATQPQVVLGARYNDRDGLIALGIDVDGCCASPDDLAWRASATPFPAADRQYAAPPRGWHQGCCMRY
jgi:hypothetical protein